MTEFRLLTDRQGHSAPAGAPCPECGKAIGGWTADSGSVRYSAAYISGGALLMREDDRAGHASDRLRAFFKLYIDNYLYRL
jgi:hypothetical protein